MWLRILHKVGLTNLADQQVVAYDRSSSLSPAWVVTAGGIVVAVILTVTCFVVLASRGLMRKETETRAMRGTTPTEDDGYLYVYEDTGSRRNRFTPSGYMGDVNDVQMDDQFKQRPHSGTTCIRVTYSAEGRGPWKRPLKWAGVYWQQPDKNWGEDPGFAGRGYDLSAYARLTFWAGAERECKIYFRVGGIDGRYGDSLKLARVIRAKLLPTWQHYTIDLRGANLQHVIGGFCWVANWEDNPNGITFYLDDIRFEKK